MSDKNYWKTVSVLLFTIVVICIIYLGNDYYQDRVIDIYNEGYNDSRVDAQWEVITYLIDKGTNCEIIPIDYYPNKTLNLVAVECLPQEVIEYMQQQVKQNG